MTALAAVPPVIFVTIGSMFPFDRLIRAMDAWAASRAASADGPAELLAQIGDGGYEPVHMRWVRSLPREDYARAVAGARIVVAALGGERRGGAMDRDASLSGGRSTPRQLYLEFILAHPAVTCVIPATSKPSHLDQNMRAGHGPELDEELRKRLLAELG